MQTRQETLRQRLQRLKAEVDARAAEAAELAEKHKQQECEQQANAGLRVMLDTLTRMGVTDHFDEAWRQRAAVYAVVDGIWFHGTTRALSFMTNNQWRTLDSLDTLVEWSGRFTPFDVSRLTGVVPLRLPA